MKVLHVAASLSPKWGGPTMVIQGLTEALVKRGVIITIFAPFRKGEECVVPKGVDVKLFPQSVFAKLWRNHSFTLAKQLKKALKEFDILHIHEIWHHSHFSAYNAAKFFGIPFVITIHGELEPWSLNYKKLKKRIYANLIQRRILREAKAIHAITNKEVESIRNFGVDNKIVVVGNGIDIEAFRSSFPKQKLLEYYPELKSKKIILFLGRLHPNKGLDILIRAFRRVVESYPETHLLIAGPDENGYQKHIAKLLAEENVAKCVTFAGILIGEKKLTALSGADLFILPSYSEGFSISILEAMASGLPVIITKQCNFPEVEKSNAGIVINPRIDELADAMTKLIGSNEIMKEMGENGKKLVGEKYNWKIISEKMFYLYQEILAKE